MTTRFVCPRGHYHLESANFCAVCGSGPVSAPPRQFIGTGLTIDPCVDCKHSSFCSAAGACLRREIKT